MEVVYVIAKRTRLLVTFQEFCKSKQLVYQHYESVLSPDNTTLFTTSGMQKRKSQFGDYSLRRLTLCDSQHCFRLNDLNEIGDSTHYLDFYMLGLFSFRHWSLKESVDFWFDFLHQVNVLPDTVTIHPTMQHHRTLYKNRDVKIVEDETCVWSDGNIGGYCTEFYKNGVEIGNIVNPMGDCIDSGFGLERILSFIDDVTLTKTLVMQRSIDSLLESGIQPSNSKQGYVLRKLLRQCFRENLVIEDNNVVENERKKYEVLKSRVPQVLKKYPSKSVEFYFDTFGIDEEMIKQFSSNFNKE